MLMTSLRAGESYSEKWNYVRDNPVRAGLVSNADEWKYAGEIEKLML
jgi:REP-associated tyrosine transposase